jgi:hypothetical protein
VAWLIIGPHLHVKSIFLQLINISFYTVTIGNPIDEWHLELAVAWLIIVRLHVKSIFLQFINISFYTVTTVNTTDEWHLELAVAWLIIGLNLHVKSIFRHLINISFYTVTTVNPTYEWHLEAGCCLTNYCSLTCKIHFSAVYKYKLSHCDLVWNYNTHI